MLVCIFLHQIEDCPNFRKVFCRQIELINIAELSAFFLVIRTLIQSMHYFPRTTLRSGWNRPFGFFMFLVFRGRIHPKFSFRVVDGNLINIRVVFGWLRSVFLRFLGLSRNNRVVYGALNKRVVQGLFILTCISAAHRSLEERVSAVSFVALLEVFASAVV